MNSISKNIENMDRNHTIDFTKGILVILMVVYHSLNYLDYGTLPHDHMAFLPPSFIMIVGIIITRYYIPKYKMNNRKLDTRLLIRAIKLVVLFTMLNLGAQIIIGGKYHRVTFMLEQFLMDWKMTYVLGNRKGIAFEILLPISYFLILSILILRLQAKTQIFIGSLTLGLIFVCVVMEYFKCSISYLNMISSGVVGLTIGLLPVRVVDKFAKNIGKIIGAIVVYGICLYIYGDKYFMQIFATVLSLLIIYVIGMKMKSKNWALRQSILMGQYSLLGYIIQIFYLQILFFVGPKVFNESANVLLIMLMVISATLASITIMNMGRNTYKMVDDLYKYIFG